MDNYIGRVLGHRYVLQEIIGVGGMAVVYKAHDNIDNKTVAVKILKDEHRANDEFRRRFKNESKAIAVLSHPNIVKVFDVSFGETVQYIVMEYIEGVTLKEYIQNKGVIDWREAVLFASQILKALQHAHTRGVIHRDIKPQNIMLLSDNKTIKVADFGIARFNNKSDTRTMADGSAIGSVHYISPEQARGVNVDNRTDIYSVGVVLYEMITGQLPFQSDSAVSVAIMQLQKNAVMPRKINPKIPLGIEQITMKAMQKQQSSRYQSADEMLLDIDAFRRNPNTKFDYMFATATAASRYAVPAQRNNVQNYASGTPIGKVEYTKQTVVTQEVDETFEAEVKAMERRSYTLPMLMGIIFVLVIVIISVAWYFFTKTEEVTIPQFEGKIIDEIREDEEFKYFFENGYIEENLVYTTDYEEGYIINQSKEAGQKVQISSTSSFVIKLNIAYTSDTMTVPTLEEGISLQEARSILQKCGFKVDARSTVDNTVKESTVIKLSPASGETVPYGSTIIIYYAVDDAGKVAIPSVIGDTLADAKADLESLGLKVSVQYEDAPAGEEGLVVKQSIAADTTVVAGETEIILTVGKSNRKSIAVSVNLPALQEYGEIYEPVYVYVGDKLIDTKSSVKLDGSVLTIEIAGTQSTTFAIYISDQEVCSGDVDFTVTPPVISNKVVNEYRDETLTLPPVTPPEETTMSSTCTIPSFSGKRYVEYYNDLINAGFDNIVMIQTSSDEVPEGDVVSVSADKYTFSREEALTAEIKVYVSTGPAE